MIGVSKLYCGSIEPSDALRYGRESSKLPSELLQFSKDKKPVIVWNMTKACNLKCRHCYAHATTKFEKNELSTSEAKLMLNDLASFGSPVILFSGGEPFLRNDLTELVHHASQKEIRTVISTNGTLITKEKANKLKGANLSYVGISIDGTSRIHDNFRGIPGSFKKAMKGLDNCINAGLKVGLRFTINKNNHQEIPLIFKILEEKRIPRICFYHLVYSGRGSQLINEDLSHNKTRLLLDKIMEYTKNLYSKNKDLEVLTVDNHADGPYIYLKLLKENPERAKKALKLLKWNEGNSSGRGIGCISWNGDVHPDQFWRHLTLDNIRKTPFSKIWSNTTHPILKKLKDKRPFLTGRCSKCKWINICGGNFRVRAEAATGDLWSPDPACYLTDKEIGII